MNIGRAAKAGADIHKSLFDLYCTLHGVHTETVIGAAAALAGDQAVRATCRELPKGRNRGGPQDDLLFAGEDRGALTLWGTVRELALTAGAKDSEIPDIRAVAARADEPQDDPLHVPLSLPEQQLPHEWSPGAPVLLRGEIAAIAQQHRLSPAEAAMAIAFALGRLIDSSKETLVPVISATLAAEIMIGVSRLDLAAMDQRGRTSPPIGPGGATLSRRMGAPIDKQARIGVRLAKTVFDAYSKLGIQVFPTTIGALAALAGERALIATGLPLPTHGFVFGGAPDKLLYGTHLVNGPRQKPNLWDIITHTAMKTGANMADLPDYDDILKRTASAVGGPDFPALSIPKEYYPVDWSPNACPRFRDSLEQFAKQSSVNNTDLAVALAWGAAVVIDAGRNKIHPAIAARLALEVMVGTSRMAPLLVPVSATPKEQTREGAVAPEKKAELSDAARNIHRLVTATEEILRMLTFGYTGPQNLFGHTPTVISAAAALAGEQARLATGRPEPADGWVRNDDASVLLYRREDDGKQTLWSIVRDAAVKAGTTAANIPTIRDVTDRMLMALGTAEFPAISVSDSDWPKELPVVSCRRFRSQLEDIRQKNKLTHEETAVALAHLIAILINGKGRSMTPGAAARLAFEVMAGMTRLVPGKATAEPLFH